MSSQKLFRFLKNDNPDLPFTLSEEDLKQQFREFLKVKKRIWLERSKGFPAVAAFVIHELEATYDEKQAQQIQDALFPIIEERLKQSVPLPFKTAFIWLIGLAVALSSCSQKKQEARVIGKWKLISTPFEGDIWKFTQDSFFISRSDTVIWKEAYSIPFDLSPQKDFNIFIFDEQFLTYAQNSPYSEYYQHFMEGTACVDNATFTWIPLAEPIDKLHLIRIQ